MASIQTQERTNILKLVAGMFNAAPGATYLNEFTDAYVALNKDLGALAAGLGQTGAFQAMYPSFLTAEEFADKFLDTLGLKANAEAQDWVKAKVTAGESYASVIFQALVAIDASTSDDFKAAKDQLANKAAVAEYYSVTQNNSADDLDTLQGVLAGVTNDPATVEAAKENATVATGKTYTLTTAIDNFAGTSGDDTFIGGNGATTTTGPADQLDGAGGNDTFKFYGGAIAMPTIKNIENLYFNATQGTLNAATIAGVESVEIENATDPAAVAGHTVTLGAAQSLKLTNINGAAANVATTVQGSAAGGITLNNVIDKSVTPNIAQTLNVNTRDTALTLNAVTAASNINLLSNSTTAAADMAALTKLTVTGDAKLTVTGNAGYTNLTTVDASASTGGVDFRQGVDTNLTFTGGTGADRVQVAAAAIVAQDKLDGGAGKDTLAISNGGLTAPAVVNVQNFEILEVRGSGVALTQDASVFDAKNTLEGLTVVNTGAAQTFTVTNLAATAKDGIVVNAGATGNTTTLTTTVKGFVSGGTSDSATVTLNANATTATATPSVTTLTFDNVDNLTLASKGTVATAVNSITVNATDMEKLTVTGNIQTIINAGTSAGITEVDASGLVVANGQALGLTFAQVGGAAQSLLVTGSNGRDTVTVTSTKGTVIANGGNDTIVFNAAAAALGDQSVNLSAKDFVAGGAQTVTFNNTSDGFAVVNFSSDIEALLKIGGVNLGTTTANQAVGAAINGQNNVALAANVLQFDVNGDGVFNAADDYQITLTGVTAVTYDAANDFFVMTTIV